MKHKQKTTSGWKGILFSLSVFASLSILPNAKADLFGVGLGLRIGEESYNSFNINFVIPLKHYQKKRPKGHVLQAGFSIGGNTYYDDERNALTYISSGSFSYLLTNDSVNVALPLAYEYVFENGVSIIVGGEFVFKGHTFQQRTDYHSYGGGVVLGSNYYFKNGVFLGFRLSTGAHVLSYRTEHYSDGVITNLIIKNYGETSYTTGTFSVGYMF